MSSSGDPQGNASYPQEGANSPSPGAAQALPSTSPPADASAVPTPSTVNGRAQAGDAGTDGSAAANGAHASNSLNERKMVIAGLVVALAGALIGGFFSYLGAWQQSRSQMAAQESQYREDRAREDREKRSDVYKGMLDSSNAFAVATDEIATDCSDGKCSPDWSKWENTRFEFQSALNNVWIYGSDDAATQAEVISTALPESIGFPKPDELRISVKSVEFAQAYSGFQALMCRELPAVPRRGC